MATFPLPLAGDAYDQSNEQRVRSTLEERLWDIESAIYGLRTTYGTVSLGEGEITLVNGTNSNIAPGYDTFIRIIGPSASFTTTGFTSGERGRLLIVRNTVAFQWTIVNEATSTAANQIVTSTGGDVLLTNTGGSVATFIYDSTSSRWILVSTQG